MHLHDVSRQQASKLTTIETMSNTLPEEPYSDNGIPQLQGFFKAPPNAICRQLKKTGTPYTTGAAPFRYFNIHESRPMETALSNEACPSPCSVS